MIIAVDFDGTVVTHEFPETGKDIGAQKVLKELVRNGHQLILFTMRSGKNLEDATKWFLVNEIPLYGIQYNPTQTQWTCSNKCYAQLYIDDAALGAPLVIPKDTKTRPYVNWRKVRNILIKQRIIAI